MEEQIKKLRIFNIVMGIFHFVQGVVMVVLSNDFMLTTTTSFLQWNEELGVPETLNEEFFSFRAGPVVAGFLFLSALFHFIISAPGTFEIYKKGLKNNINAFRWIEYSLSSSLMIVLIAMLSGMFDFPSLVLIFALNATMNLFGWIMEEHNKTTEKTNWLSFIFGCFAGIVPWAVIALYFYSAIASSGDSVPTFVYFILVTLFIFFNIFPINMILQYKKIGPWRNYLFGEAMYIVLSLLAKSALAWQVFGGTLRP